MNFIRINDPKIKNIPIRECNEPLNDAAGKQWIIIRPSRTTDYQFSKVRSSVLQRLEQAASLLPKDFRLELEDGHRPLHKQREFFLEHQNNLKKKHPDWSESKLFNETSLFVAPAESTPPHTTGGAIDVLLCDEAETMLDLGGYGTPNEGYDDLAFTDSKRITDEQKHLRTILATALKKSGFVNYPAEWWHWSYGDQYWAYMSGHPFALYGSV